MCKYAGGKKRIAKELHDVMIEVETELIGKKLPYLEPFCGMLSVCAEFNDGRKRTASDINKDVVMMWNEILYKRWTPPKSHISKKDYDKLKYSEEHSPERGFYGTACSFAGYFMASLHRIYGNEEQIAWTRILEMIPKLKNTKIYHKSYDSYIPKGLLIYCDPPYSNTKKHSKYNNSEFDNTQFWDIIRKWSVENLVFISEEKAPKDFKCIWCKTISRNSSTIQKTKAKEKLFIHESYIHL